MWVGVGGKKGTCRETNVQPRQVGKAASTRTIAAYMWSLLLGNFAKLFGSAGDLQDINPLSASSAMFAAQAR